MEKLDVIVIGLIQSVIVHLSSCALSVHAGFRQEIHVALSRRTK